MGQLHFLASLEFSNMNPTRDTFYWLLFSIDQMGGGFQIVSLAVDFEFFFSSFLKFIELICSQLWL